MKGIINLDEYLPFESTMGESGRATIPAEVRRKFNLKPGVPIVGYLKVIK